MTHDLKKRVEGLLSRRRNLKEGLEKNEFFTKDAYLETLNIINELFAKNKKYREVLEYILEHECDRELIELVRRVLNDITH